MFIGAPVSFQGSSTHSGEIGKWNVVVRSVAGVLGGYTESMNHE